MPTKPKPEPTPADEPDPRPDPTPDPTLDPTPDPTPTPAPTPAAPLPSAPAMGADWRYLFFAALGVIAVYLAYALLAFIRADDALPETDWSRSVYVLLGVEAIAFTAVGFLFGREVHRGEAKQAERNAAEAKQDARTEQGRADAAKEDAAKERSRAEAEKHKGRMLAAAVNTLTDAEEPAPAGGRTRDLDSPPTRPRSHDALRDIANRLYPPD